METEILAVKHNCIVIYVEQKTVWERSNFRYDEKVLKTKDRNEQWILSTSNNKRYRVVFLSFKNLLT